MGEIDRIAPESDKSDKSKPQCQPEEVEKAGFCVHLGIAADHYQLVAEFQL